MKEEMTKEERGGVEKKERGGAEEVRGGRRNGCGWLGRKSRRKIIEEI